MEAANAINEVGDIKGAVRSTKGIEKKSIRDGIEGRTGPDAETMAGGFKGATDEKVAK